MLDSCDIAAESDQWVLSGLDELSPGPRPRPSGSATHSDRRDPTPTNHRDPTRRRIPQPGLYLPRLLPVCEQFLQETASCRLRHTTTRDPPWQRRGQRPLLRVSDFAVVGGASMRQARFDSRGHVPGAGRDGLAEQPSPEDVAGVVDSGVDP